MKKKKSIWLLLLSLVLFIGMIPMNTLAAQNGLMNVRTGLQGGNTNSILIIAILLAISVLCFTLVIIRRKRYHDEDEEITDQETALTDDAE